VITEAETSCVAAWPVEDVVVKGGKQRERATRERMERTGRTRLREGREREGVGAVRWPSTCVGVLAASAAASAVRAGSSEAVVGCVD
jgi:hypothetical protein